MLKLADWIQIESFHDQLIVEYYTPGEPNRDGYIELITKATKKTSFLRLQMKVKLNTNLFLGKAKDLI